MDHQKQTSPEVPMASTKFDRRSSSSSSGEVSVTVKKENDINTAGAGADVDSREEAVGGSASNGVTNSSGTPGMELTRVKTLPSEKPQSPSDHLKLERSKTEKPTHSGGFAQEAAKIFDDKISEQQKLKLLKRIATVKDDGTVEFEIPGDVETTEVLGTGSESVHTAVEDEPLDATELQYFPPMQIVILIVGTRGDVQPFTAIGKRLQDFGHRVRLATHANFKEFVLSAGLEFYPLGGDPKILAGYMVKNKGFLPSGPSEIPVQRNQMKEIIYSLLPACKEPDMDTGVPFKADAIIANPPAYGHVHVAEALQIPIHIFFTMPWTPTSEFPHPLSRVKQPAGYRLSYQIVDTLIWLGIRDMINDLRKKKLKLRPVTYLSGSQSSELDIPHAYIWSPHLVPKPKDWGPKIDVVGFCFLDLATGYEPPESLVNWLKAGPKPIYIGFGSLPVQDPQGMTNTIVKALEVTNQRGIINKGWGGLGTLAEPKDFVYLLDNVPHDWLFLQCAAVVHHGGAGTTAAGLKAACPTTIVPFFGDQPFWGERVHARGVGPLPIEADQFTLDRLVHAIRFMLNPEVKERAIELAKAMENEDGVTGAVKAFFKQLSRTKSEPQKSPKPTSTYSLRRCFGCS
ncbi:sterol 3-beta-glucosyltransferase UGT80A2-like isoform X1 [Solanum stenotomum]|uniref:sterol 3-beta-glucosyltransferase UGT80A2-like isoform X1 n=1 Tax=Solanum stenotomum TaxID=172797 RepID=UPI0020D1420B|nr:sterol 3-beta-glucosyltransferase UGT80A2-like isoform X1 [Solanum stenotomum]